MQTRAEARELVLRQFRLHHRVESLDEVRRTKTPGYWERCEPCGGRAGGCRHPLHQCMFNEGPVRHTLSYFDPPRDERGRWASPTRTWDAYGSDE